MTSKNLSLTEKMKNHRKYISRTLWTSFIALPLMAAYYVLALIMMLSRASNYARIYHQTPDVLYQEKLRAVSRIMGMDQLGWVLVGFVAFMFAFQGFSYMFSQSQLDFYMSQPTTRRQRVTKNIFNAVSTFLIIYILVEALGLIVAACYGAISGPLLLMVLLETLRTIVFFLAIYNLTVLAMMLSGTIPMAVLLTMFFGCISVVIGGELFAFTRLFFDTCSYNEDLNVIASPIFDRATVMFRFTELSQEKDFLLNTESVMRFVDVSFWHDLDTLIVAVVSLVLVGVAARARKAEWAGKTIVYRPFRWLVKIVASIAVGLGVGLLVREIYTIVWNEKLYLILFLCMLLATLASCVIAEIILSGDIKAFAKGKGQTVIALALLTLVFVIFKGDLIGYDSYVPSAGRVESCCILSDYDNGLSLYLGQGDYFNNYQKNYMFITNTEDFLKLAKIGMKEMNEAGARYRNNEVYDKNAWEFSIMYRLKNGREVYRRIMIPDDTDPALMDSIFASKEYIEGSFHFFNDEAFRNEDKYNKKRDLTFTSCNGAKTAKIGSYDEISDALRKDLLENFGYTKLRDKLPVGEIDYNISGDNYGNLNFRIYDSYTNTIELLKKYGIYNYCEITVDMIDSIKIVNYLPGMDPEEFAEGEEWPDVEPVEVTYESKEDIERILEASVMTEYYGKWYDYTKFDDNKYSVQVNYDGAPAEGWLSYSFLKGQIPEFVIRDTDN